MTHVAGSNGGKLNGMLIGVAAGGSVVLVVLSLLCVLLLVVKRSCKTSDSYGTSSSCAYRNPFDTEPTVRMNYNPSYGIIDKDGNTVKMHSNPSYDVAYDMGEWKMGEEHYSYVDFNEAPLSHHREGTVKMKTDPSCQSAMGDDMLYDIADVRKETTDEHYYYVEPNKPVQYENTVKVKANPSTGGDSSRAISDSNFYTPVM